VHRATGEAISAAGSALRDGSGLSRTVMDSLADVAEGMVADLLACPDAAVALDDLSAFDSYTHRHSVQVTVLGLLIARRMWERDGWVDFRGRVRRDRIEDRLRKLGLGLLVHDVGKLAVPPEILNKPGRLSDDEMAVMRCHPHDGVELLRPADISPLAVSIVRDHHERLDATGYPAGIDAAKLGEFPRIAAVADVYDAVTSERVYKAAAPPHVGVEVIAAGAGTQFCPTVVSHFRALVFPYPVGHEIPLPDGRTGVVAGVDPEHPERPRVRVTGAGGAVDELTVDMGAGTPVAA
jgi:HD-GYP domain-containing protein (c-di-GMP phosphodiesterase class II)